MQAIVQGALVTLQHLPDPRRHLGFCLRPGLTVHHSFALEELQRRCAPDTVGLRWIALVIHFDLQTRTRPPISRATASTAGVIVQQGPYEETLK